ncbi:hypothetical protein Bca101_097767 [Brassica carinata]
MTSAKKPPRIQVLIKFDMILFSAKNREEKNVLFFNQMCLVYNGEKCSFWS